LHHFAFTDGNFFAIRECVVKRFWKEYGKHYRFSISVITIFPEFKSVAMPQHFRKHPEASFLKKNI